MSVKQLPNGRWQARWRDVDGRQRAANRRTEALAKRAEREARTDTSRGLPTAPRKKLSTGAWMEQWLAGARNLADSTQRIYREALGHVSVLEDIPLHRLTAGDIDQALGAYADTGAAASSVSRTYRALRRMLNVAVARDLILRSPLPAVQAPAVPRKEMRFLTAEQLERLAGTIDDRYRALVLVGGWGGLRYGELAGLRAADVDHPRAQVRVAGQLSKDGRRWKPETKGAGRRAVDLPDSVMADLPAAAAGYVWTLPRGGPLEHAKFRQRFWVPAVVEAGLGTLTKDDATGRSHYDGLRVHDLRHTSVALAVAAGAHPSEIQAQLGHASITTTLDEYGHIMPTATRQVAKRLDALRADARQLRAV